MKLKGQSLRFWVRSSWKESPVSCIVILALLLGVTGFVFKHAGTFAASRTMTVLSVEADVYGTIEKAVGGSDSVAKAEAAVSAQWPFPQCGVETPKERLRRLAVAVLCFDAKLEVFPSSGDLKEAIEETAAAYKEAEKQDGAAYMLQELKQKDETLRKQLEQIEKWKRERAGILQGADRTLSVFYQELEGAKAEDKKFASSIPSLAPSCVPLERWLDYGPDTEVCAEGLNESSAFPVSSHAIIVALLEMGLSERTLKDSAQTYVGAEDEEGWGLFPGGVRVRPYGPTREFILHHLGATGISAKPLRLPALQSLANHVLKTTKERTDIAEDVGKDVQDASYSGFSDTVKKGTIFLLLLVALLVAAAGARQGRGWRRAVSVIGLAFIAVTLMTPAALSALDLEAAKLAIGSPEGVAGILGAPFALAAQLADVIQGWLVSLWDFKTVSNLILAGLFGLLFVGQAASSVVIAAVGILLAERWFATGSFSLLPFDIAAFEAAVFMPVVGWLGQLLGFAVAILLLRGLWVLAGEGMVRWGTGLLVTDTTGATGQRGPEGNIPRNP